jgi:hydrogenase small subunit
MPCPVPTSNAAGHPVDNLVFEPSPEPTSNGVVRREFLRRACVIAAATIGLPKAAAASFFEETVVKGKKPSVIWLHFQE